MEMFARWYQWLRRHNAPVSIRDFSGTEFVDITNAADYFYTSEPEIWDIDENIPVATLPWDLAWMEFKFPRFAKDSGNEITSTFPLNMYSGARCYQMPIKPEHGRRAIEENLAHQLLKRAVWANNPQHKFLVDEEDTRERIQAALATGRPARWLLSIDIFFAFGHRVVPYELTNFYLDPTGRIISEMMGSVPMLPGMMEEWAKNDMASALVAAFPYLYAISLLHCKNVDLEEAQFPRSTMRRAKQREVPDVVFKQLHVRPMGAPATEHKPSSADTYQKKRLHICRGHFKDYRKGAGLFGRYPGLYWWAQQLRGELDQGIVIKDYIVETE